MMDIILTGTEAPDQGCPSKRIKPTPQIKTVDSLTPAKTAPAGDDILSAATTQTVYRKAAHFEPRRIADFFLEAVS
ncbi:hypothetical protein ACFV0O_03770 [Kitasatospora sp. NPDC059577]|uniref:hypothetical protein n=1 Tax=Kitasatospora sp. NPDC059577 TaxID=3346873 RepID=UPI0036CCA09B